jgi:hypothetical protein
VREIRSLRLTGRGLETESRRPPRQPSTLPYLTGRGYGPEIVKVWCVDSSAASYEAAGSVPDQEPITVASSEPGEVSRRTSRFQD